MFTDQTYTRLYAELSTYRTLAVLSARNAIETNDHRRYTFSEEQYEQLNGIIQRNFGEFEKLMMSNLPRLTEDSEFPEWPPYTMRPVFSDAEIDAMPLVFSDGSVIDDECDVPF